MKANILSFITASALLIGTNGTAFATNDSTKVSSTEQRIEKSAKELAAESIELATVAIKQAKENSETLKTEINNRLDDTIIDSKAIKSRRSSEEYINRYNNRLSEEEIMMDKAMNMVEKIGKGITVFVAVIIALIILGIYLNRRQKYKIIEKAIENNYPLPPGFLGKNLRPTTTTIQHIHYTQEQARSGQIPTGGKKITQEFNITDWANFRSGIKWTAWGLSFMLFFLIVEAPVWVFALIPVIIGVGKLYVAYRLYKEQEKQTVKEEDILDNVTPPSFNAEDNTRENK